MKELNTKERIQQQVSHWVNLIREFDNNLKDIDCNSKDYHHTTRLQAEYKGRIYAVRFFEDVLGFEFDTSFIN